MRHSMFDFILHRKNIQTINKRKTQDYYYTIIQRNFSCFEFRIILHECSCYKGNKWTTLKQLLIFLFCLMKKTLRIEKKLFCQQTDCIFCAVLPVHQ